MAMTMLVMEATEDTVTVDTVIMATQLTVGTDMVTQLTEDMVMATQATLDMVMDMVMDIQPMVTEDTGKICIIIVVVSIVIIVSIFQIW